MKISKTIAFFLFLGLFQTCSKDNPEDLNPCPKTNYDELIVNIEDEFTTLPSKVSVFFKVDEKNGNPVAGLKPTDFMIYEQGRNDDCPLLISSNESQAQINTSSQVFNYHTMLVLDFSGSVIVNSLQELKDASKSFIENVMPETPDDSYKMGIWWFDGENELHQLIDFTTERSQLLTKIDEVSANLSTDPSTDLYGATLKATANITQKLEDIVSNEIISAASVVIFTDGRDQAARHSKDDALLAVEMASPQISFFTIGLGDEIDQNILTKIGKNGTIFAADKADLEEKFRQTGDLVFAEANSYYLFEYCSPKRDGSGISNLIIVAESLDGKRGFAQTEFDATGFTGGCN